MVKKDTCLVRMNLSTLEKLRDIIPPKLRESLADYFFRVANIIEDSYNNDERGDRYYD